MADNDKAVKLDETVVGGAYLVNGVLVNAEGVAIESKTKADLKEVQADNAKDAKAAEKARKEAEELAKKQEEEARLAAELEAAKTANKAN